jgi:hypothetical protein
MALPIEWVDVQSRLRPGLVIRNWTAARGYLGDAFSILSVSSSAVEVIAPNAVTVQRVSKKDLDFMQMNWEAYCSGKITRGKLVEKTRVSKYSMSILKHLSE